MLSERGRHYEKGFNKIFLWRALWDSLERALAGALGSIGLREIHNATINPHV